MPINKTENVGSKIDIRKMKASKPGFFFALLLCVLTVSCKENRVAPIGEPALEADTICDTVADIVYDTTGISGFVNLTDVVPDAMLEIRYYGTYNFVGQRIEGYLQPTALLSRRAADSLRAVSDDLKARGYRLKIYDAYRPQMAVNHFVRWNRDYSDTLMRRYFYPNVDRRRLFALGYIASKSGHSRGSTVDLTLFDMRTGKEVDMGGTFDWFGNESHPDCGGDPATGRYRPNDTISAEQFRNRMLLRGAMLRHGFRPLGTEWWHFTLRNEPYPDRYFNFPVREIRN